MAPDDSSLSARPADSRSIHIRAARAQIEAARLRQQQQSVAERIPVTLRDAILPKKFPPGYTLLRELHRGGQGVVYVAIQQSTGRQVAIKILHGGPPSAVGATGLARFRREIEILSRLKHPHIVTIHDCGRDDQHVYLVMDYVDGRPLDAFVDRDRTPLAETLNLFARICDGVNAAHIRGVVHRDLKPGNILVDEHGAPHVLDFGLAKLADDSADGAPPRDMTATGQFVGSLPWASPEQAEGRSESLDIRTDVYSLGVVLYQLLTGRFPYPVTGRLDDVVRHIVNANPVRPSTIQRSVDRELDTILLKCLAKEPERRYQNAGELARDLRRYLAGQAIEARSDSAWYIVCKQLRQHRAAVLAGLAFVGLLIASSITAWSLYASAVSARNSEQARLWESLVAQARAGRNADRVGRRVDSLSAIRRARDIRFERELRDEAVACLALPDLRCVADIGDTHLATARGLLTTDRFACTPADGRIEVRAIPDGSLIASLDAGESRVVPMCFSPNGAFLSAKATAPAPTSLWLWETATRKLVRRVDCSSFDGGDFSRDNQRFGVVTSDGKLRLFDVTSDAPGVEVSVGFKIGRFEFDPAGARLALVAFDDPTVAIWDLAQSRVARTLRIPAEPYATSWSPDGKTLAVGTEDHMVYLYDAAGDSPPRALGGHRGQVVAVGFNSAGNHLASGGWDRQVRVWDISRSMGLMATFVGCHLVGLSDRLAVRQHDHLRVWEFVEVGVVRELRTGDDDCARSACFVGDGKLIAASGPGGIRLLDVDHPENSIVLDLRDTRRPTASRDGHHVYALVAGEIVEWALDTRPDGVKVAARRVAPTAERPSDVAVSADQRSLLVSSGSEIVLHDAANGAVLKRAEIGPGAESPVLSPDGRHAFVGNWKGSQRAACVVDLETMQIGKRFPGESVSAAFSSDGRRLVVCTPTHVQVCDIPAQTLRWSIPREPGQELAVRPAFSPDGRLMALSASLYEIHLVDADNGQLLLRLPNPALHMVGGLEFSSDGRSLLAATSSSVVHVWNLDALRRELRTMRLDW